MGRGTNTQSYVPVAAKLFVTARGWLDEAPNDPAYVDFAQLTGIESDGKDFEDVLPIIEGAAKTGMWVVLAGHDMRASGSQTTRLAMLERLSALRCRPGQWGLGGAGGDGRTSCAGPARPIEMSAGQRGWPLSIRAALRIPRSVTGTTSNCIRVCCSSSGITTNRPELEE